MNSRLVNSPVRIGFRVRIRVTVNPNKGTLPGGFTRENLIGGLTGENYPGENSPRTSMTVFFSYFFKNKMDQLNKCASFLIFPFAH